MRLAIVLFAALPALLSAAPAWAMNFDLKDVTYSVEPIVGYDLQRKTDPQPHAKLVLTYGARVIAGYKIIAAEGEYTRGKSDEEYPLSSLRIEETSQEIKVGVRSSPEIYPGISLAVRGGAQLSEVHAKTTSNGTVTESDRPSRVDPYVGAGLSANLGGIVALSAEGTMTVRDWNDITKSEFQGTLGLRISLNSK